MRELISERTFKAGYVVRKYLLSGADAMGAPSFEMKTAYTPDGHYIGNPKDAYHLCKKRGIQPELITPGSNVCSIGFCEREGKWYGWSHRAIYGFGVGSETKRGDCSYVPFDREDARRDAIGFWSGDEHHYNTRADTEGLDEDGRLYFDVTWTYTDGVPNEKLRGTAAGVRHYAPEEYGKGEWTATTIEEAKQMAIDFAKGVA